MADLWMPGVERRPENNGSNLVGGPPRAVWHITWDELGPGGKMPSFNAIADYLKRVNYCPHIMWDPWTGKIVQFYPADMSARALVNLAGGVETNRMGRACIQVEVFFSPGAVVGGKKYKTVADTPCKGMDEIVDWMREWDIPDRWPRGWPRWSGNSRSTTTWREQAGHFGHCFPPGTLVGGAVPVRIEEATEVIGHDGRLHKVAERMERPYEGDLVSIKAVGAAPIRCTPDHPILVVRPYRFPSGLLSKPGRQAHQRVSTVVEHYADQPEWLPASEIVPGDYLVSPRFQASNEPGPVDWAWESAPGTRANSVKRLEPGSDTAWMLGLYAADGSSQKNGIEFVLGAGADNDLERLVALWRRLGLEPDVREHGTYRRVRINSRTVGRSFSHWFGKKSEKHFPGFVLADGWPWEDVIAGYVAGDGTTYADSHIVADTISPTLAEQLRTMLVALGESPVVMPLAPKSNTYPNASPMLRLSWSPAAVQHRTAWWRGHYLMPVSQIGTEHYAGPVFNIDVQEAHTYTVSGATVHNCHVPENDHTDPGPMPKSMFTEPGPEEEPVRYYGQLNNGPSAVTPISLHPGDVGSIGFVADNGIAGKPPVKLRVGVHDKNGWYAREITVDSAAAKSWFDFRDAKTTDGVSVVREDDGSVPVAWDAG